MRRPGPFDEIKNLPIRGEATVWPNPGEATDKALRRIKIRLSKYAAEGRYYRAKIDGDAIRVQRTPEGCNTKIGDWLMMQAGERLLLALNPTPLDVKKARDQAAYITMRRTENHPKGIPYWNILVDRKNRLVAECWGDLDGNIVNPTREDDNLLRTPWTK